MNVTNFTQCHSSAPFITSDSDVNIYVLAKWKMKVGSAVAKQMYNALRQLKFSRLMLNC